MNKSKLGNSAVSRCVSILNFWHKIEFFIPFDLKRQVLEAKDAETSVRTYSQVQLDGADGKGLWIVDPPSGKKLIGFEVFLGVFELSELTEVTQRVVHEALTSEEEFEQEQRGELDGLSCYARVKVSATGEPHFDEVSISTAPWALGCIQKNGLEGLNFENFRADFITLRESLNNFQNLRTTKAKPEKSLQSQDGDSNFAATEYSLTGADLSELLEILYEWAGFSPVSSRSDAPILVIRTRIAEDRKSDSIAEGKDQSHKGNSVKAEDDDSEGEILGSDIGILNSFYAQDIARAIDSLQRGDSCPALLAYLSHIPDKERINLYGTEGREQIPITLSPDRLTSGHWFDPPKHTSSLMQQFAINSVFECLQKPGVFSVNGPPGTGKTTLLRDIFAEIIVRRARVLAKYETAGEAFVTDSLKAKFEGIDKPSYIAQLKDDLTGFEMVVASSNNAAVENISRDLPKSKALGKYDILGDNPWRDVHGKANAQYLKQVAFNVSARNAKGEYDTLPIDDEPWGLISCALGKMSNRKTFVDRISYPTTKQLKQLKTFPKSFDVDLHQSIWSWRDNYKGLDYNGARLAFLEADKTVKNLLQRLALFAELQGELRNQTLATFSRASADKLHDAQLILGVAIQELKTADDEWKLCNTQLDILSAEEKLLEKALPGLWGRLINSPAYTEAKRKLEFNRQEQGVWLRRKSLIEEPRQTGLNIVERSKSSVKIATNELEHCRADWESKQKLLSELFKDFPEASCPTDSNQLEEPRWQIDGLWRDEYLNRKRSELFAAALQLHEAWLSEVLKERGRFGSNIVALCQLLSGKRLETRMHALPIWQSLFMLVPVMSTTFASIASQFADLGSNSFGWLFIDEAGQAVPQAAVGALWRSKRAVVVGDPLQIEPVFTVPIKLIEALAKSSALQSDLDVQPHHVSVQNLADAANPLGVWIESTEKKRWIGSPLRVHRRCVDPMFSIANEIAYDGKMIFFAPDDPNKRNPPAGSFDLGASAWVHSTGHTNSRQVVVGQIELVQNALAALYQRTATLPPIYIISPFKRIQEELTSRISKPENWYQLVAGGQVRLPKKHILREWARKHIGTVHTFQGKEESVVWMVLGCDQKTQGAAAWASSKPNLLNVALTRAQHRFFMIGDVNLWGGLRHFKAAHDGVLPRITPNQFLDRMMNTQYSISG